MHNDLNTAETDSATLLVGTYRKDPPEKRVLPMVRPTLATSVARWETATFGGDWDCRGWLRKGLNLLRKKILSLANDPPVKA